MRFQRHWLAQDRISCQTPLFVGIGNERQIHRPLQDLVHNGPQSPAANTFGIEVCIMPVVGHQVLLFNFRIFYKRGVGRRPPVLPYPHYRSGLQIRP